MKVRDEMPLVEMAYDFCLAGNEMDAARILRMLLDRHKQAPPRLTKGEVKVIVKRRLKGYEARQRQRVERREEMKERYECT